MNNRHRPRRSWVIALGYFTTCWLVAWWSGALELLTTQAIVTEEQATNPWFWLATVTTAAAAGIGYWVIWPRGTTTMGRPFSPAAAVFGLAHGASEGVLYLSLWAQLPASMSRVVVVGVAFGAIATFNTLWRTLLWDVWVTPEHNIQEWNLRKVLWVHAPVLLLVLGHLAVYERAMLFVVFETIALTGSAVRMRFPSPRSHASADEH